MLKTVWLDGGTISWLILLNYLHNEVMDATFPGGLNTYYYLGWKLKQGIYTVHMECYEINLLIPSWYYSSIAISCLQISAQ